MAVCALVSVAFVTARGGLELPLASVTPPPAVVATPTPPGATTAPVASPTTMPSGSLPSDSPSPSASPEPTPPPSAGPTPTPDPLAALPNCPDRPECHIYTVRRGDTLGRIADRFAVPYAIVLALNPEIADPSTIVIGQTIYLGRDAFARLEPCPDRDACYRYVVQPGDRLSTIAGRFGVTLAAILELNPAIDDPNQIFSGQVIRLPDPTPSP